MNTTNQGRTTTTTAKRAVVAAIIVARLLIVVAGMDPDAGRPRRESAPDYATEETSR